MPHLHVNGPATYADAPRVIDSALVGEHGPELLDVSAGFAGASVPTPTDTAPSEPTSPGHPTDEAAPVVLTAARVARLPRQRVTPRVTDDGPEAA
jgi:hypothetical protein